jgi:hypothetical protein
MSPRTIRLLLLIVALSARTVGPIAEARPAYDDGRKAIEREVASSTISRAKVSVGGWRRTSQGWQQTDGWMSDLDSIVISPASRIHPLLLAVLIGLLSVAALIGLDTSQRTPR